MLPKVICFMVSRILISVCCLALLHTGAHAQSAAIDYMGEISAHYEAFSNSMWSYISTAAHGKNARKVESRRKELINTAIAAQRAISAMAPFEGDAAYRDSSANYFKLSAIVLREDFEQIVNLEEVAEQSYDAMEAYMAAKDIAYTKLNEAGERMAVFEKVFAQNHNVNLLENTDKVSKNLAIAGEVYNYYNPLYLLFFKCYKQEAYLLDAVNNGDVNAIAQNQNALNDCATASFAKFTATLCYKGDCSVSRAGNGLMQFYQKEATKNAAVISDFFLQKENFEKMQKAFNAIPQAKRTQADVDRFNASVEAFNKASAAYNKVNSESNQERQNLLNAWNSAVEKFLDAKIPH